MNDMWNNNYEECGNFNNPIEKTKKQDNIKKNIIKKRLNYACLEGEVYKEQISIFDGEKLTTNCIDKKGKFNLEDIDIENGVKIITNLNKEEIYYTCIIWKPFIYLCESFNVEIIENYTSNNIDSVYLYRKNIIKQIHELINNKDIFDKNRQNLFEGIKNEFLTFENKEDVEILIFIKLLTHSFFIKSFEDFGKLLEKLLNIGIEKSLNERIKEINLNLNRDFLYNSKEKQNTINYISKLRLNSCFKEEFLALLLYKIKDLIKKEETYNNMEKILKAEGKVTIDILKYECLL